MGEARANMKYPFKSLNIYLFILLDYLFIINLFVYFLYLFVYYLFIYLFIHLFIDLFIYLFIHSHLKMYTYLRHVVGICRYTIPDATNQRQPQKPSPEGHWLSHPGLIPTIMASVATLKGGGQVCDSLLVASCRFWKVVFRWLISLLPNKHGELVTGVEMHHVSTVLRENARTVYGF